MASQHRITCVNKEHRQNPHECIKHVGGINDNGTRWRLTQAEAIAYIENKTYEFFVRSGTHVAWVIVAMSPYGHKYLKTQSDGYLPDNLLSLNECPLS